MIKFSCGLLLVLVLLAPPARADLLVKDGQKVVFMGDSITELGWNLPGGYVHLVVSGLKTLGVNIVPIPAGISGQTSREMVARTPADVVGNKPDWLTLSCGVNDVWHGAGGVELDPYEKNITSIVDQAQAAGSKVMLLTSTPIGEDLPNPNNVKLVAYNDFLKQLAKTRNLPVADENAAFQAAITAAGTPGVNAITMDGVHPNPIGNVIMAKAIQTSQADPGLGVHCPGLRSASHALKSSHRGEPPHRMRLSSLAALLVMTTAPLDAQAQPLPLLQESSSGEIFLGPATPADRDAWLAAMKQWRTETRAKLKFDDSLYTAPELVWTQRTFVQPQMMCEERYFYDPAARQYTVDRYLDDLEARYGGIDSVLIWPVYPNVGIDNRNQHDMLRAMPGGLAGVKRMVADFHRRGVHVLFPMMPWETGTREEGVSMAEAVARDFKEAGIDGVNGDTMNGISKEFLDACRAQNHLLAFEPENAMSDIAMVQWDVLSWGYWDKPVAPLVDRYKWLEPRHRSHLCDRWQKNRIFDIQTSFVNGDGYESWESIWGCWNGFTPRAGEALRRVSTIQRSLADYLVSPDWEPHVPTLQAGVYASKFPGKDGTLYLFINRSDKNLDGAQITVSAPDAAAYRDVWHGTGIVVSRGKGVATVSFPIEAGGFGAVFVRNSGARVGTSLEPVSPEDAAFDQWYTPLLSQMAKLTQKPLASFDDTWTMLLQQIVPIAPTAKAASAPDGMVAIPAAKYHFKVKGVEIEGDDNYGVDFQYPWEQRPWKAHEHDIDIPAFYIDKFPVTNSQFKAFLTATNYHPADDYNFLKNWSHGTFLAFGPGQEKKPVTWVSLEDARAYAKWAGKRLPHEWEWQYAAQGTDGRAYPWGTAPDESAIPAPVKGHDLTGPDNVDAHPKGASPFGVMDLVGNVWQWTDEFQDEHTRAAVVRGDSYYQPQGSMWYFPRNPTLDVHGKYLLMCPGKDRAGTLGFRCVKDK